MDGTVEPNLDALITLHVQGPAGGEKVEAVVDTGFSGRLSLPHALIETLGLEYLHSVAAVLADGSVIDVRIYEAEIEWHGAWRTVRVDEASTDPLVGMRLLRGSTLCIDVTEGGRVAIEPLPADA